MKRFLVLFCLVPLASALGTYKREYEPKEENRPLEEKRWKPHNFHAEADLPTETNGYPLREKSKQDPALIEGSYKREDELMEEARPQKALNGRLVNPHELAAEEQAERPTEEENGVPVGDETKFEQQQDPALYGWEYYSYSWCTQAGRDYYNPLHKQVGVEITAAQCRSLCEARPGCKAVEFWGKYNWACFVCTDVTLITPYTNERDLAYPAHVWVQKPAPATTPYPSITPGPTLPSYDDVNVTCGKDEMWISIPKYLLYGLDKEHLRLNDISCGATETETHFILHTSTLGCGTKSRKTSSDYICYSNTVFEIPVQPYQIITRVREVCIPFFCYYSNWGVVSSVGLEVKSKKIIFSQKGYGEFELWLDIYPDKSYVSPFQKKDFPVHIKLRQLLFVELIVHTEDDRLTILAEDCFATPFADPEETSGPRYYLIKDGCAVDSTVVFLESFKNQIQKFKFEAFQFLGDFDFVYLHCKAKICNASDPYSRCAQGCLAHRRKRSAIEAESKDDEYFVAQGPFMRQDVVEEEQLEDQNKIAQDFSQSPHQFTSALIAMGVVATVCIVGISYFVWDKRKRSTLIKYQRLAVPVEE